MKLHELALLAVERTRLEQHRVADPELAHVAQQAREDELLLRGAVEVQPPGHGLDAGRDLVRARPHERVLGLDGVGEHPHDREVGGAKPAVEPVGLEHGSGVVAEREQDFVVELLEAAGAVGADDHALEVVTHVDGDRDEVLDLLVGGRVAVARGVLADDLVPLHHPVREALCERALAGVALEAAVADEVELAVAVLVLLGEEQAPLGARQLDRHFEHELADIAVRTVAAIQVQHLPAQLPRPFALGTARAFGAEAHLPLTRQPAALVVELTAKGAQLAVVLARRQLVLLGPGRHGAAALLVERGSPPHGGVFVGPGGHARDGGHAEHDREERVVELARRGRGRSGRWPPRPPPGAVRALRGCGPWAYRCAP